MKILFPYQREALTCVLDRLRTQKRILIVMATGLGKTVIAGALVRWWLRHQKTPVLFLVHLWEAIDQAVAEFQEALGPKVNLQTLMAGRRLDLTADVVFCTFQTMRRRFRKVRRAAFGLVIVDEGHRSKANTYEPIVEYFEPDLRFAMTATPDRMDGRDIRDLFGEEVYSYPLSRALAEKQLADVEYRVLMDNVSLAALRRIMIRIGRGDRRVSRDLIDREVFLAERLDSIVRIIKGEQKKRHQTIIFCNSRKHAKAVGKHFPEAKTFYAGLPRRILEERFRAFKVGELKTVIVVNKFNEAIDIPDADLIAFLRTTESRTIWLQQLGRGLRKRPHKKNVLVLDFVANCDRIRDVGQLIDDTRRHLSIADDDVEVHRAGIEFNFNTEAREILTVLKRIERDLYLTWEEAAKAVRAMGIASGPQYRKRYGGDTRLPSQPSRSYVSVWRKRDGWPGFLGTAHYKTWSEAARAARSLKITSEPEYNRRYKEDPRLPSSPAKVYASVWKEKGGSRGFLGRPRLYEKWSEAARAARTIGIDSELEYHRRYKEDPRLPSNPQTKYVSIWKKNGGWNGFFGRPPKRRYAEVCYKTWAQASVAVRTLGIQTAKEYKKRYRRHPRLPGHPELLYEVTWKKNGGWPGFLGKIPKRGSRTTSR